jgi:hypothetical protein
LYHYVPFLPKHFGDVGQATLKGPNITATFIGGRRFGLGLYIDDVKALVGLCTLESS